ncbi:hypothetical protein JXO59_10235, partial [candidate division KSB1 bacterium]|nr:hypothetical protein [candidate division KSB1 bacterium]
LRFTGGSQITGPRGEILMHAHKSHEQVGAVDFKPEIAREKWLTDQNHLLQDRKTAFYSRL